MTPNAQAITTLVVQPKEAHLYPKYPTMVLPADDIGITEKPLKPQIKTTGRVDINVLKSKLQETESKELKKNIYILSSLVAGLGALGVYLSL
mgnify:CR=1 FL=1